MKDAIKLISLLVGIIFGIVGTVWTVITIWNWINPPQRLEAHIIATRAPLPPALKQQLESLGDFSLKKIREEYRNDEKVAQVKDVIIQEALPVFSKVTKDNVEKLFLINDFQGDYINSMILRNTGGKTLNNVQVRSRHTTIESVLIDRGDGNPEVAKFSGFLNIGDLPPKAEVSVFAYSITPYLFEGSSTSITHDEGVGRISVYKPVPQFISQQGGLFISYYWTTIFLLSVVVLIIGFFTLRWILQRRKNN